ncbi:NAD(P)/FAD-dependent oxidoreductase [Vagococcus elongatus]|uniref:Ferredoxin--NADP reductase n=1 Tax=Vagococcus elongatus TaxID=180344 RepID=A0A430AM84_9ENTE|nr:NAD(P)/FAD-dependent oxidoreductase [Vagococcus elongatus]RSU09209.1 ferredoxin--NADP(+) reductase [Vagococcus elongatus]
MSQKEVFDITIIGGGPTGLFAGFYAGMRNAKTLLIESLPQLGGQLAMLYPEKHIYDVAGFPEVPAQELVDNLKEQVMKFHHTIALNETVLGITPIDEKQIEVTTTKRTYLTKTVIITAGNGSFQPKRLQVEGSLLCENRSLHYIISDMQKFNGKNVMISGGGDSAIDWALMLEPIANSVTLVHRRNQFRAHEHSVKQLNQSKIQLRTPFVIKELSHDQGEIYSVKIENPKDKIQEIMPIDDLIVNFGFSSSLGPIKEWQLALKGQSILVNSDMSTNIPGIYAAGDICTYPGKVDLIATGFGEAPTAVNNALHYAMPELRIQPGHSTSMF